jgi:hypothetical protein
MWNIFILDVECTYTIRQNLDFIEESNDYYKDNIFPLLNYVIKHYAMEAIWGVCV